MNRVCDDCIERCEKHNGKQIQVPVHRFFKFMLHKYHSQFMPLPPEFARRVTHLENHETRIEDSDGEQWPVTLSRVEGSLAFQKGWGQFYSDHGLKAGQVLFFNYTERKHFTVCIFSTSACERTNFTCEMSRRSKKRRRDIGTASEEESYQTAGVNSKDKTISASGNEFQNHKVNQVAEKADAIKASGNLSLMIPDITKKLTKLQQMLDQVTGPVHAETEQHVVISGNTSGAKINLSGNGDLELTNPERVDIPFEQAEKTANNAEMPLVNTDPVTNNSGDSSNKKSEKAFPEKALVGKAADSHTEITEQISKKVDDTLMAPHSSQGGGHSLDASTKKSSEKPSDSCKMKMYDTLMLNNVSDCQQGKHGSFSASPSIGNNKIAAREHVVKRKFGDSAFSLAVESPIDLPAIKKELRAIKKEVVMDDKANASRRLSRCVNELAKVKNYAERTPLVAVKDEPDLFEIDAINPLSNCPFSAEVKSQPYLELPLPIDVASCRWRQRKHLIIYLRETNRKLWPVAYIEYHAGRALTINWTEFCKQNDINPGDECRFQVEDLDSSIFKVDVTRGSACFPFLQLT